MDYINHGITRLIQPTQKTARLISDVLGGCAAENRGADFVKYLVPSLRARTRYLTGHREPHNQAMLACAAPGAGQHRDYVPEKLR